MLMPLLVEISLDNIHGEYTARRTRSGEEGVLLLRRSTLLNVEVA